MKKVTFILIAFMMVSVTAVMAQNPVPDPDTVDPVKQGDPAFRHLPKENGGENEMKRIASEEIPDPVRRTLESSTRYANWEKAMIFRNKDKDEYMIEFIEADKTTAYRFDKNGKPLKKE